MKPFVIILFTVAVIVAVFNLIAFPILSLVAVLVILIMAFLTMLGMGMGDTDSPIFWITPLVLLFWVAWPLVLNQALDYTGYLGWLTAPIVVLAVVVMVQWLRYLWDRLFGD